MRLRNQIKFFAILLIFLSIVCASKISGTEYPIGDLNQNGYVNSDDWLIMRDNWQISNSNADLNNDVIVNTVDFSLMNKNWQNIAVLSPNGGEMLIKDNPCEIEWISTNITSVTISLHKGSNSNLVRTISSNFPAFSGQCTWTVPVDIAVSSDYKIMVMNNVSPHEIDMSDDYFSVRDPETCTDGTIYGQCSTTKPLYCDNGILVDKASLCGCPSGFTIYSDGCLRVVPANEQIVKSFNFEDGSGEKPESWITGTDNPSGTEFNWENSTGYLSSRSISITSTSASDAKWIYNINLNPQEIYRLSGYIKGQNIINVDGGTIGAHLNALTWDMTEDLKGSFDWRKVNEVFHASSGTTDIKARLGFFWNTVTGKAWFDNIVLTSNPLTRYEGSHIYLMLEPSDLTAISDSKMKQWIINLDKAYNSYLDLVGTKPYDGEKIEVLSVIRYPGGWAVAGPPIRWMQQYVRPELTAINNYNDWSFGIIHEIGHAFDIDYRWVWDGEFFANLKLCYVVENLNAKVEQSGKYYVGNQLETFYKTDAENSYEKTLKIGIYHNDGLDYKFLYIKNQIGWEPFKQTFR